MPCCNTIFFLKCKETRTPFAWFPTPGSLLGPRPWPPALAHNLYLPALAPNLCLPTLAPNLYLPALAPNLCLPALAPNFYLPALVSPKPGLADTSLVPPIWIYWPWPTIFITVLWICIICNSSNFLGLHNTNSSMSILVN